MYSVIIKYTKIGDLKFISHLDILRLMQRAINRANLPAKYSEGFNPHMKTSFGFPLSLGVESLGEYFMLELKEHVDENDIVQRLNNVMPSKMKIINAKYYEGKESLMKMCKFAEYIINIENEKNNIVDIDELNILLDRMTNDGITFIKERKKAKNKSIKIVKKEINTKFFIKYARAKRLSEDKIVIEVIFITSDNGSMKASDFIKLIEENSIKIDYYSSIKIDSLSDNMEPIIK